MGKIIAFVNQKGGVGKTLLADELAFEFDRENIGYNIYDIDGQGGLIHKQKRTEDAKYNIVDTPGQLTEDVTEVIKQSDVIIVPTRASERDQEPLERTLELIARTKKKKAAVIIVLNGWNRYESYAQFEEWLSGVYTDYKIITLPQSEPLNRAGSYGQSIIEYNVRNQAASQLKKLWSIVKYELGMKI